MNDLLHPIQLPGISIPGNIFLAPMAGFTDRAMRELCIDFGANFTFSEMVSCEGLNRGNQKTSNLLEHGSKEKLFGIQLFTSSPEAAAIAAVKTLAHNPTVIDLNCGCPVPKVVKTGAGSALMQTPEVIGHIVKAMKKALLKNNAAQVAVTVKLRSGWDKDNISFLTAAKAAEDAGADIISLHPRTKKQGYSGKADWDYISRLKKAVSCPVIGSGDLFSEDDILSMLTETKCDGVMVARGAIGNPFIFQQVKQNDKTEISAEKKLKAAADQLKQTIAYHGEILACKEMKKHLCAYTKGIPGGAELRNKLVKCHHTSEYYTHFEAFLKDYHCRHNL